MNSLQWLRYYQDNELNRPEPKWNMPSPLDAGAQLILAHSLSHFQLGETGEGKFIVAQAKVQSPDDVAYHQALQLFIAEEGEHARLLERLVHRFGGKIIRQHWTHFLFRLARRALGFNFLSSQSWLAPRITGCSTHAREIPFWKKRARSS
jgi:hypothetical protein